MKSDRDNTRLENTNACNTARARHYSDEAEPCATAVNEQARTTNADVPANLSPMASAIASGQENGSAEDPAALYRLANGISDPIITECKFDNGLIAPKVGTFRTAGELTAESVEILRAKALEGGYSVIYISSSQPVDALSDCWKGQLIEFTGDLDTALSVLNKFPHKYEVRSVKESDWPHIFELYRHTFLTRFSRDANIGLDRTRRHKLICMRTYCKDHSDFFLVTLDKEGQIIGVQGCMARPAQFDLYESVIHPRFRTGFAVTEMLRENLTRCRDRHPSVTRLVTRIYSDNIVSSNYYEKLGMIQFGGDHFYHLWIDQRRQPLAMDKDALRNRIARFLQERFLVEFGKNADGTTDLFKGGFIDSFGFMELVSFLETEFKIEYQAEELLLGQLNSLDGLQDSVYNKQLPVANHACAPVSLS